MKSKTVGFGCWIRMMTMQGIDDMIIIEPIDVCDNHCRTMKNMLLRPLVAVIDHKQRIMMLIKNNDDGLQRKTFGRSRRSRA